MPNLHPDDTLLVSLLCEFDVKTEQDCSLTLTHRESGRQVSYHMDRRRKLSQSFFEQAYNLCKNYFPQSEYVGVFTELEKSRLQSKAG